MITKIRVMCPGCRAGIELPARYRGQAIKCPKCKRGVSVPRGRGCEAPEPPEPPAPLLSPAPPAPPVIALAPTQEAPETTESKQEGHQWNPGFAVLLSVFIPGLGQIYKGEIIKGFLFFACQFALSILGFVAAAMLHFMPLVLTGLAFYVAVVYDAYNYQPRKGQGQ